MKKLVCLLLAVAALLSCLALAGGASALADDGARAESVADVSDADAPAGETDVSDTDAPAGEADVPDADAPAVDAEAPAVDAEAPAGEGEDAESSSGEAEPGWFRSAIEKITELKWYTIAILAVLVAFALILTLGAKNVKWDARALANAAVCIAVGFVLSSIRLFRMPQGGTVTPVSMLPLILFAMAYGPVRGFVVGCAFGLLNLVQDPWVIHPVQLLVDYPLAYAAVALCCAGKRLRADKKWRLVLAVPLGYLGRYAMAVLSGVVFFAEYAGDQNALIYSLGYNISYLWPEILMGMAIMLIPGMTRLADAMKKRAGA